MKCVEDGVQVACKAYIGYIWVCGFVLFGWAAHDSSNSLI